MIADFNTEPKTNLGSEITSHRRVPSDVKWALDSEIFHGDIGKSLRIEYIRLAGKKTGEFLFVGRRGQGQCMTTRQYARLVSEWIGSIGLARLSHAMR